MNKLALLPLLVFSISTAACGDEASCDKVVDHTLEVMPAELKDQMGDKGAMVKKCESEMSEEQRKCALEAKDMKGVMACSKKG